MLDQSTRQTILRLREAGHGTRAIAKALKISRGAVKDVLKSGEPKVPKLARSEKAEPFRDEILALHQRCKGNLIRVHEELVAKGVGISYQALTAFCRRHHIGHEPKRPAGRYDFAPGEEMQHDTSPHTAKIGGKDRSVQSASLVLCYSRLRFFQAYPTFNRFYCKVFLTDALRYMEGSATQCMIDNTHVVVLRGTGKDMVAVPEMVSFGERFGFTFAAHELGDANRSARVEGPFDHIENNFYAGREFEDFADLNRQAIAWCDKTNAAFSRHLHASRRELYAAEAPALVPLPIHIPDVYQLHQRVVDLEGYVNLHSNRYSVPFELIGRSVEVREEKDRVLVFEGPRQVAEHARVIDERGTRVTSDEHRPPRGGRKARRALPPEQAELLRLAPELERYFMTLKERRGTMSLRAFLRLVRDYPRPPLVAAVATATSYGLYDVARLERMVLKKIAKDYFVLPLGERGDDE